MALLSKEEKILNSIRVPSQNNPDKPEFPPDKPRFPATPTFKIKVNGFSDIWLKDESVNPTGTKGYGQNILQGNYISNKCYK